MKSLFLDSDIFVRDLRYKRDVHFEANQKLIEKIAAGEISAVTSIFNVLEVCGVLSFNLSMEQLTDLYLGFPGRYHIKILVPFDAGGRIDYDIFSLFEQIRKRQSLGDAETAFVVQRFSRHLDSFVSWNARHFEGKIPIPAKTPESF